MTESAASRCPPDVGRRWAPEFGSQQRLVRPDLLRVGISQPQFDGPDVGRWREPRRRRVLRPVRFRVLPSRVPVDQRVAVVDRVCGRRESSRDRHTYEPAPVRSNVAAPSHVSPVAENPLNVRS